MTPAQKLELVSGFLHDLAASSPPDAMRYLQGALIGLEFARGQIPVAMLAPQPVWEPAKLPAEMPDGLRRRAVAEPAPQPSADPPAPPIAVAPPAAPPAAEARPANRTEPSDPPKWTDARKDVLRAMYPAGKSGAEMAAQCNALPGLPCTGKNCIDMANYLGLRRAPSASDQPGEWTPEQQDELRRMWPQITRCTMADIRTTLNTMPGVRVPHDAALRKAAVNLGLPALRLDAADAASAAATPPEEATPEPPAAPQPEEAAPQAAPAATPPPVKWTAERKAVLAMLYPGGASPEAMADAVNALPGEPATPDQCTSQARNLGLKRPPAPKAAHLLGQRDTVEARRAALPAGNPNKAEAMELFAAGRTGRQVAEDLDIPLSDAATWAAEYRAQQRSNAA